MTLTSRYATSTPGFRSGNVSSGRTCGNRHSRELAQWRVRLVTAGAVQAGQPLPPRWGSLSSRLSLAQICVTVVLLQVANAIPLSRDFGIRFPPTLRFERALLSREQATIGSFAILQLLPFHDTLARPQLVLLQSRRLGFALSFPSLFELPQVPETPPPVGAACSVPTLPSQLYGRGTWPRRPSAVRT